MATPASAPPKGPNFGTPNQTLYCSNLPDKVKKNDLRRELYTLFSTHGPVLDVVAMRTPKLRGQAHIVFRDIETSTTALKALQGFEFYGKPMKISYGKGKSQIIDKLRGTYTPPTAANGQAQTAPDGTGISTDLQKSIFGAPPSKATAGATAPPPPPPTTEGPQGTKRPREEESDKEDAPMDEESDAPMEDSSDEDD